jgi:DNA-binding transcriptional ArsR family regulator
MDELDYFILQYFEEIGTPGGEPVAEKPTTVWMNIAEIRNLTNKRSNTVNRHMQKLADAGLLEKFDEKRGYYMITELGCRTARRELSDEERQEISERF